MNKKDKKQAKFAAKKNFHVVYGKHAVEAILANSKRIVYNLFLSHELKNQVNLHDHQGINIEYCDKERLTKLCKDGEKHQGYIAYVGDLLQDLSLEDYILNFQKQNNVKIIILDQINDPHNLGAILRSAMCFSVDLVIITKYNMPPINSSVIRSSAGMSEYIDILTVVNLSDTISALKAANIYVIGMDLDGENKNIANIMEDKSKIAVVMGSEGFGIRPSVSKSCDIIARIGMNPGAESLNVSNAAAIAMYEMFKNTHQD